MSLRPVLQSALKSRRASPAAATFKRIFTATAAIMGKQEWMAILPDVPGKLEARMKVRPYACPYPISPFAATLDLRWSLALAPSLTAIRRQHLEAIKPKIASGQIVFGGASLDEPLKDGEGMKSNGSVMIVEADTYEEAESVIKGDVYYTSGVWDAEKVKIFPFKSAVREALK